ncbi:tRNA (guanosine(18)-2'-O)-methyltransferase TrmH [Corallincola luteus]|uniref:tRNA (guanosine(18)-2'-O)-methyltransferase n=1 Tax=Corallincola luteus TaxID=1775177 RepID=A0ABY2AP10_9GAMM|nr:tRNA (guanosine(18)-2'-O)-methyltransferase TrmH [Corallincola luteus]TCI04069.1 tRNA (guanosine(18)-2'-O)-methyltransferase TrmH [Corallincola luteus]
MNHSRFSRISALLDRRQPDLTVVMDEVHKPMNMAAIIRSCDAIGIPKVHAIWPEKSMRISGNTASGSQQWVDVAVYQDAESCLSKLKSEGMQLVVTHLDAKAVDFRQVDYTRPTAILVGHEKFGASETALACADQTIVIPMLGAVQSLNVSAATAVVLYEAQRQREMAGMYQQPKPLDSRVRHRMLFESCHPIFAKLCKKKGLPYAELDDDGEIIATDDWWQQMRTKSNG